jgi:phosphate-selective porin OprO/OprP
MGQQVFFQYRLQVVSDGEVTRVAPQGSWMAGPFGIYAEHMTTTQVLRHTATGSTATVDVRSWHVAGSVLVTGERQTLAKVVPRSPFSPSAGGWGALEIAARVERFAAGDGVFPQFASPDTSVAIARAWGVSAIWYLTRGFKILSSFERTSFTGAVGGVNRRSETALISRMQLYF